VRDGVVTFRSITISNHGVNITRDEGGQVGSAKVDVHGQYNPILDIFGRFLALEHEWLVGKII
jgi:hypothetical protein